MSVQASAVSPPGVASKTVRAEFPPLQYWRRWCGDAPPAVLPTQDSVAVVAPPAAPAVAAAPGEPPYRILIVEDDRSQALFAQTILSGAGMAAQAVSVAGEMMQAMEAFQPELVLMDLHMPGMSGTELTGLIRAHAGFAHVPVVFLTGDTDPERQVEVLESGADDFISKPVRPRHLIAAVTGRVQRARTLRTQRSGDGRHPVTGLQTRTGMLKLLAAAIPGASPGGPTGALYFLEVENTSALRDRFGYTALDEVLTEAGRRIAAIAGAVAQVARLNDNTFLLHAPGLERGELTNWARTLRDGLGRDAFMIDNQALRLRALVGFAALDLGFTDASAALGAAEQALRHARTVPIGIAEHQPTAAEDVARHQAFDEELHAALAAGSFELAFQPIVAVAGGDEAQYQALLRLRRADGNVHLAADIVPAAEAAGLMLEIDRCVLQQAVEVLRGRQAEGKPVRLFVSQSPASLGDAGHVAALLDALAGNGIDGGWLVVDVRQGDALVHAGTLHEFCAAVSASGTRLCLSQYQSGEEADALLAQLPLSFVRLSGQYAARLDDPAIRNEMRWAIERAHRLGLQVIGQQVEDPQAAATLWMSGVDYIQGNLVQMVAGDLTFDFQHSVL